MWSLKWFLCLSTGVTCVYALIFTSLREKTEEELQGKVFCRGHFLIWQNLSEHAQNRLEITLLCLFFVVLIYVTVKLAGESGETVHLALLEGKRKRLSLKKTNMFHTLTLLEMDLVKFMSRLQNLKLDVATSSNFNPHNVQVPADTQSNITDYELWGDEESD
ncbi:hypothetical protein FD755_015980 [Muntiacus reevesi]|uniref:Uncharacterized protein n=1 Tax=Muntiacus reevesi TaxID=9886 RepID=A0A5N3XDJ0_MUNRE|nr:hypothetical protein FD755_015980 [Muntiacus reevesi]